MKFSLSSGNVLICALSISSVPEPEPSPNSLLHKPLPAEKYTPGLQEPRIRGRKSQISHDEIKDFENNEAFRKTAEEEAKGHSRQKECGVCPVLKDEQPPCGPVLTPVCLGET